MPIGDFFPDCDLKNLAQNGECGPLDNQAFGQAVVNTVPDAGFMSGWNKRQYNWQASLGVEHELRPGIALSGTYYRRWFGNFVVTDNTQVTPQDYDPFCITAPTDARLGDISGSQVCGLYDIKPAKFGQVANVQGLAQKFGNPTEVYNGFDVNIAARFGKGGRISGGWNIGNTFVSGSVGGTTFSGTDNCFVVDSPQQLYNCKSENPVSAAPQAEWIVPAALGLAGGRELPEHPGGELRRELHGVERRDRAVARPPARGHDQRHDRPAAAGLRIPRGPHHADGCAVLQDAPLWPHARCRRTSISITPSMPARCCRSTRPTARTG